MSVGTVYFGQARNTFVCLPLAAVVFDRFPREVSFELATQCLDSALLPRQRSVVAQICVWNRHVSLPG